MICDLCGCGLKRWIKVSLPNGREYLFCGIEHLIDFFNDMLAGQ